MFVDCAGSIDASAVSGVVLPSKTSSKAASFANTSEQIQAVEEQASTAGLLVRVAAGTAAGLNKSKTKENEGFNKYHVVSRQVSLLLQRQWGYC